MIPSFDTLLAILTSVQAIFSCVAIYFDEDSTFNNLEIKG